MGRPRPQLMGNSVLEAIDYKSGDIRWKHEIGPGEGVAGILTTAGKLVFTQDNNDNLVALDPGTGKTLWHVNVGGRMVASPMTYQLDGRQYVLTPIGNVMFAWALPEK